MKNINKYLISVSLFSSCLMIACKKDPEKLPDDLSGDAADVKSLTSLEIIRGRKDIEYKALSGEIEKCVLPKHLPGVEYKKKDEKNEETLCSYNFYKKPGTTDIGEAVGLCPKLVSTNPAVDIESLENIPKKDVFENTDCKKADRKSEKLAKYKQSITCCYSASPLAYYHMSRILDVLDVPVAVLRTMDLNAHKEITKKGILWSGTEYINTTWKGFQMHENNPAKLNDSLFIKSRKQIYGALIKNVKGEEKYSEINVGSIAGFMAKAQVKRVFDAKSVQKLVAKDFAQAAPIIIQMKDISDMLIIDYLFKQQDRFGNIAKKYYYYYLKEGKVEKIEKNDVDKGKEKQPPASVLVTEMILKDNDCGFRPNHEKNITDAHITALRHLNPKTYKNLRWLAKEWVKPEVQAFFKDELLLGMPDALKQIGFNVIQKTIQSVAKILYTNCKEGKLLLDLNLEDHINAKNTEVEVKKMCELI